MLAPPKTPPGDSGDAVTKPLHHRLPAQRPSLPYGTRLGRYVVCERIGCGGMGSVYRGHDTRLKREVALKLVRIDTSMCDPEPHELVFAEARAMAQVAHPNVLPIHDVDVFDDAVCIVMEYVDGTTLDHWLTTALPSRRDIVDVMLRAGRGLAAAHTAGLVHGDFKPHNVLVGRDGRVRVTDFGLARAVDDELVPSGPAHRLAGSPQPWGAIANVVYGTPQYMAPERRRGHPGEPRSDQFSFCVSLYQALHGVFPDSSGHKTTTASRQGPAPPIPLVARAEYPRWQSANQPPWLDAVLARGLSGDVSERWPDMPTLLDALARGSHPANDPHQTSPSTRPAPRCDATRTRRRRGFTDTGAPAGTRSMPSHRRRPRRA
ncbi:MAG: serine/threonine protein kinase [Myxococcales bacterium FL481]|nr:MAG: serine/threonine protein kinase [Myxococcales bacterium FL481]